MNIKRILALTLAAVLVLTMALAGCGENASTSSTAGSTGGNISAVDTTMFEMGSQTIPHLKF